MSTRSTSSNLFSPLRDPESLIRRRNLGEPSSLFDFEEVMSIPHNNQGPPPAGPPPPNNNGPPPVVRPNGPAPRSMEELCQPSINGRGRLIAPIPIQATDFGLRHVMIQQPKSSSGVSSKGSTSIGIPIISSTSSGLIAKELDECLALADLGANINLMPLSVWKKLSLSELTPTRMTLELANRSVAYLVGVAKDVFVKVGKFYLLAYFVVVDYDVDPRVPLILGRPFLRTARALIDVHDEELTLRVNDEAITFKVGHTSRYSLCSRSAWISDSWTSGNPTPSKPIIASSPHSFTPFKGGEFILEEIETFLHTPDELSNLDDDYYDTERDILYLEILLNEDPSSNLHPMKNDDLKQVDVTITKPSIEEPPELELKDFPPHLEYAFLEETDKLPVIIAKDLKDDEKDRLLKLLKLHKRAIAWKISDIKGVDP
ncbi:reverse transcriptase domain-containing protein [Tanacetum coccineum]